MVFRNMSASKAITTLHPARGNALDLEETIHFLLPQTKCIKFVDRLTF